VLWWTHNACRRPGHPAIDTLKQVLDAFASGGKLEIRDSNGKVVESWDTWEALKRHIDRWSELKE